MKKRDLHVKLNLKKKKIASLVSKNLRGGFDNSDPETVNNSLGKQSTCPIETCTCLEDKV
ncbi:hypothetical protein [Kordia sp.]|uniref:hypothetical protein n=1 Tax=Kordia sp. TaxID=1965332 RepID=UPI003B5B936A